MRRTHTITPNTTQERTLTVHKEQTRLAALQDDGSLASESASDHNHDSTGGTASSDLGGVSNGNITLLLLNIVSRIVLTLDTLGLRSSLIFESEFLHNIYNNTR